MTAATGAATFKAVVFFVSGAFERVAVKDLFAALAAGASGFAGATILSSGFDGILAGLAARFAADGFAADGFAADGFAADGFAADGFAADGFGASATGSAAGCASTFFARTVFAFAMSEPLRLLAAPHNNAGRRAFQEQILCAAAKNRIAT
jgi:hypothetical protein